MDPATSVHKTMPVDRNRFATLDRRHFLTVGAAVLAAGCLEGSDEDTTHTTRTPTETPTPPDVTSTPVDAGHEDEWGDEDDWDDEELVDSLEFEGFTHFPADFSAFFTDLDDIDLATNQPIVPFFSPQKVVGAGKWYLVHPHDDAPIDHEWGMRHSSWKTYLVADAVLTLHHLERESAGEVDGETVYLDFELRVHVSPEVHVLYDKFRLRQAIADDIIDAGGEAIFPAGTHLGYGLNAFGVSDDSVDIGVVMHPGVNPFPYFTDGMQQELLEVYEGAYSRYRAEGIHPFTDLTEGRHGWDVPGSLPGGWIREADIREVTEDGSVRTEYVESADWSLLSLFPTAVLNEDTYWRVIEHPWNVEQQFVGLFVETERLAPTETPLYAGEPLGQSRLYLVDGDLTAGVAMIISRWEWQPLEPDGEDNHPSVGERRYLRFEIEAEDSDRDGLTIEGFEGAEGAIAGFTDEAVVYRRLRAA